MIQEKLSAGAEFSGREPALHAQGPGLHSQHKREENGNASISERAYRTETLHFQCSYLELHIIFYLIF